MLLYLKVHFPRNEFHISKTIVFINVHHLTNRLARVQSSFLPVRHFGEKVERVIASKNTANVKRDPAIVNQLKRGSHKISIKNMVILLVATNVVLAGLVYNKNRKLKNNAENNESQQS